MMETETIPEINFFKIELIRNSTLAILKKIFKNRWEQVFKNEWKSEFGGSLKKILKNKKLDKSIITTIEDGNLNGWNLEILCLILLNFPNNETDQISTQNKLILNINEINNNFLKINENNNIEINYKIKEGDYKKMRESLFQSIIGLMGKEEGESIIQIIKDRIDIVPSKDTIERCKIGGDSEEEEEANKFVEMGEIEFEKLNFQRSIDCYNDALLYNGFNDIKRSLLLSRLSMINLRYYQQMMLDSEYSYIFYIKKQQLEDSKRDAVLACSLCPLQCQGYFRGAQILCFLGHLEVAISFLNAALAIDENDQDVLEFKNQIQCKIDSRCWTLDQFTSERKRDFEKEAENFVEAHKYTDYYNGKDLQLDIYTKGIDEMSKLYHLPRQHFVNIACSRVAGTYSKKKNYEMAIKYLSHAAGGDFAICAYRLGSIYERGLGIEKDLNLALSLYYEASLKPLKFDIPNDIPNMREENKQLMERNEGVNMACVILGHIFSKGIGSEIDMDQAIHYYQRAVNQSNSPEALLSLAQISFYGMDGKEPNKKKAIELVKRGADLGDKDCKQEYHHFSGTTPPNKLTGVGINASFKTFFIIMFTFIIILSIFFEIFTTSIQNGHGINNNKLYTYPQNSRAYKSLIAAKYVNVDIEVPAFNFETDRNEEFRTNFPLGKVPALLTEQGPLFESNAMARYVARLNNSTIYGSDAYTAALNDQWIDYSANEIDPNAIPWLYAILGYYDYNAKDTNKAKENMKKVLSFLDAQLLNKPFLTGFRVALADIIVVCSLFNFYRMVFEPTFRSPYVNVNRWFTTCINQPNFKAVIGEFALCEKMMAYVPPKKEVKEEKPKAAPAPKKEVKEDDEEAEEKPKKKNPLDELPPSTFVLDEFKRTYSNNEVTMSIPWFFEHFDKEGFSVYKCDYQYNEELGPVFKTCNLVGGFFQRLETLHKYAFSSMIIFGKEENGSVKDQSVSGVWVFRGQDLPADMKDCDDSLVYDWKKLDVVADKAIIESYFAWEDKEGGFAGKQFLQGKLYK
ncbi:hypothetical protein ACTA71_009040 [Dictyostelium dimigraforme]